MICPRSHSQEMADVMLVWPTYSPLASPVEGMGDGAKCLARVAFSKAIPLVFTERYM